MHSYRGFLLIFLSGLIGLATLCFAPARALAQQPTQPRVVEDVTITGNRRLRTEDVLYWVQTRQGDPFNEQQIQRDLQSILAPGSFDIGKSWDCTGDGSCCGWV